MIGLKIKLARQFAGQPPAKAEAARKLAELGAALLQRRIEKTGRDAEGRPLPEPKSRFLMLPVWSPLVGRLPTEGRSRVKRKGSNNSQALWYLWARPYVELKTALGRKPWRGSSFSGEMWNKLAATIKPGNSLSGVEIRIRFAGSVKVLTNKGPGRFQNRDKAYWTQFAKRDGNTGGGGRITERAEEASRSAPTRRDFALMRWSDTELSELAALWLSQVQLFAPR
ncbi:MAG: hypothetical protein IV100_17795 [Myxococcales bacterium]|nr:hypothetical protein [Myxococcales bacterium]